MKECDKILASWQQQNEQMKKDIAELKKELGNKKIDIGGLLW